MPKIVVVLPTYNEAENLPLMADALFKLPFDNFHLLVVDDNSPDGTGKIADQLAAQNPHIKVMHRTEKGGQGAAYVAGFKHAISTMEADYIIQMDCDFSHQPKYLVEMVAAAENYDLVIGSRYVKGGSVDERWSIFRKGLSAFANGIYVRTLLNVPIHDATAGYRLWRRQTLIGIDLDRVRSNGYVFHVEMAYLSYRLGFKIKEVPIHFPDRELGTSKMDLRTQLEAAVRVWQVMMRNRSLTPQMRRTKAYTA